MKMQQQQQCCSRICYSLAHLGIQREVYSVRGRESPRGRTRIPFEFPARARGDKTTGEPYLLRVVLKFFFRCCCCCITIHIYIYTQLRFVFEKFRAPDDDFVLFTLARVFYGSFENSRRRARACAYKIVLYATCQRRGCASLRHIFRALLLYAMRIPGGCGFTDEELAS